MTKKSRQMLWAAVFAAGVSVPSIARAQTTYQWNQPAGGTWNSASNWASNAVPPSGTGTRLQFDATGAAGYVATNDIGAFTLNGIALNNTSAGTLQVSSATLLTLNGTTPAITATGTGASTIASNLTYAASSTVTNSGSGLLSVIGNNTFASGTTTTFTGAGNMTVGGTSGASLTFASSATTSIVYSGSGVFSLADGGTYAGATSIINLSNTGTGVFNIGNMSPVSGTLNILAGTVKFAGNTGGDLFGNSITLNVAAGATFDFAGNGETMGAISGTGIITGGGVTAQVTGNRTWGGSIQGTAGFSTGVAGANWTFTGNNTSSGTTTVFLGSTLSIGNGGTTGSVAGNLNVAGALTFNRSDDFTYAAVIANSGTNGGTINKLGAGTLTLTGSSTNTGAWTVSAGRLRVFNNTVARAITVADGAALSIVNSSPAASYAMSTLSLGTGTSAANLSLEMLGGSAPTAGVINATGSLSLNGSVNLTVAPNFALNVGDTIPLIKYTGIGGLGLAGFSTINLPPRTSGSLTDTGTQLNLNITAVDSPVWTGSTSDVWDTGTAVGVGGTQNFKGLTSASATNFITADQVLFDDSAAGNFNVSLPASVQPGAVVFNNSTNAYTLQGAGAITGTASLTKSGTNTVSIANNNTYTGQTFVNAGTLQVGSGGASGALGTGVVTVAAAGTLAFNRSDNTSVANVITGAGTINKLGANTLTLLASSTGFTGTLNVNAGTVQLNDLGAGGDINAAAININTGGKFIFGPSGNPDFPDTTVITIAAGGEIDFQQGESYGATRLQGGTYRFTSATGSVANGMNLAAGPNAGFIVEAGSIISTTTGTNTGSITGSATNPFTKTTAGVATVSGRVVIAAAMPINLQEGTLSFDSTAWPSGAATAALTLGGTSTAGVMQLTGIGTATTSRPLATNAGGGTIEVTDAAGSYSITGALSGTGPLTKTGAGVLTITPGAGTGAITVSAGTLRAAPGTLGAVAVAAGAKFGIANTVTPGTLNVSTLALPATASTLVFDLTSPGNPTLPLINITTTDGLTNAGGTHAINVSTAGTLTAGTFTLIDYAGTPITSGFSLGTLPARTGASIVYNTANTSIDLSVTGAESIKWNGNVSAVWDSGTAVDVGGTNNWKGAVSSVSTNFFNDIVTFDDTAAGNFNVSLATALAPQSVTVNNALNTYTFSGPGSLTGTTGITKQGTGTLIVTTANDNTGPTVISGGTLQVGSGGTAGNLGTGAITIDPAGTLAINRSDDITLANTITGTGAVAKSGTNTVTLSANYASTGTTTIAGGSLVLSSNSSYTFAGSTAGPGTFVKAGTGTLTLGGTIANAVSNFSAAGSVIVTGSLASTTTNVTAGSIAIGNGGTAGNATGAIALSSGVTMTLNRTDDFTMSALISGAGAITKSQTNRATLSGTPSYTGATTISAGTLEFANPTDGSVGAISVGANTLAVSGAGKLTAGNISGTGAINKSGTGTLYLPGNNGFTGTLNVNGGTVLLDDDAALGGDLNAANIVINSGGKFVFGSPAGVNPDFPDTTFITVNTGGEYQIRIGEQWGAAKLAGGTYRITGNGGSVGSTFNATNGAFLGFALESGQVIAENVGAGTGTITSNGLNGGVTKTTAGTVSFSGRVLIAGGTNISIKEGALEFDAASLPASGAGIITLGDATTAGTFRLTGAVPATSSRLFSVSAGGGFIDVPEPTGLLTLTGQITGSSPVTKTGAGTLSMVPALSMTGTITAGAGTLRMSAGNASGPYAVANGATLAVTATAGPFGPARLTLGSTASTINLDYDVFGNPISPGINVTADDGLVTSGGTHTINLTNVQSFSPGTFPLIDYAISGTNTAVTSGFTLGALPARTSAAIVYNTANTSIDVNITAVDSVVWNGNLSGDWDAGTLPGVGGTQNFKLASNSAATNFIPFDRVKFDDTAAGNYTVNLTSAVNPFAVTVDNTTSTYTFQGAGSITGQGGLTKLGTGTLVIATDNTYTGNTLVNFGTVQIGNGGTNGAVVGNIAVASGATLTFNRGAAAAQTYAGVLSGVGNLTKTGPGTVTLTNNSNAFTGAITIDQGTLVLDDLGAGGDLSATSITVNNSGTFVFGENGNADFPNTTFLTINTGGVAEFRQAEDFGGVNLKGGTLRFAGARTGVSINAGGTGNLYAFESGTVTTAFTGAGGGGALGPATAVLDKTTAGTVSLTGTVTLLDGVTVNVREGTLAMNDVNFPVAGAGVITLGDTATTGTIRLTGTGAVSTARNIALATGGGAIDVADPAGALTVSTPVTGTGSLTKTGPGLTTLSATSTYTGPTTVSAGRLKVTGSVVASSGVTVNGGTFEAAAASPVVQSLTVNAGGTAEVTSPALTVLTTSALALTGTGNVDLHKNAMVVDYTGASPLGGVGGLQSKLLAAYNGGAWTGKGIGSTEVAASVGSSKLLAVGYAEASDIFGPAGGLFDFGQGVTKTVDGTAILMRTTLAGDADLSGDVGLNDLLRLANHYGLTTTTGWYDGDFDYSGDIGLNDLLQLANNYGQALPSSPIPGAPANFQSDLELAFELAAAGQTSVPEPTGLGLAAVAATAMLAKRRRRNA